MEGNLLYTPDGGGGGALHTSFRFCSVLIPVVPPLPSKKTVVPFIVEGATALLTPTTTNTPHPQLTFVWTKNGERITEGEKYTVLDESGVLQIDDFSLADEGEYRCVGSNGYSEAQRDFWPKTSE